MISIILCIGAGILVGFVVRNSRFIKHTGTLLNVVITLLFFFLGISVGNNEQVVRNFTTIGLDASILTISGTLGSLLGIKWVYTKFFNRKHISRDNAVTSDLQNNVSTPEKTSE